MIWNKLEQIEADVVIVLQNEEMAGNVIPLWECELSRTELIQQGVKYALRFSEDVGGGGTKYFIYDYRTEKDMKEIENMRALDKPSS